MPYLLDTSVFIEAKNDFYGMDFCPADLPHFIVQFPDMHVVQIP